MHKLLAGTVIASLLPILGAVGASAQSRGAMTVAAADDSAPLSLYERSFALVVGIDDYSAGWPRLSNAVNDAEAVARELETRGFEVTFATDLDADALEDTVEDFVYERGRDPEARLLIWFAGHGHTIDEEAYLVPADAPAPTDDWEFRRKALSLRDFGKFMREVRAKHVLAIFDSCFSGGVFATARALPPPAITRATGFPVRQMISSGDADQTVSDDGTFRRLFLDALSGLEPLADANRDGYLTGSELGLFLSDKVTTLTENRQTPRYGTLRALGFDRGDFVFRVGTEEEPGRPDQVAAVATQQRTAPQVAETPQVPTPALPTATPEPAAEQQARLPDGRSGLVDGTPPAQAPTEVSAAVKGYVQRFRDAVRDAGLGEVARNSITVPSCDACVPHMIYCIAEIASVADLRDKTVRVNQDGLDLVKQAGGSPQLLPFSEVYPALERGLIDCFVGGGGPPTQ